MRTAVFTLEKTIDVTGSVFLGSMIATAIGLGIHACVDGGRYGARHAGACEPYAFAIGFKSSDKEFSVCRDIDGGFQIREVK